MPRYIIEREVPGAGQMGAEQLRDAARESNVVCNELGPADIQWITSYYTDDKIYCVYIARDEDILLEHARCLDIPANRVSRVITTIDPATGE